MVQGSRLWPWLVRVLIVFHIQFSHGKFLNLLELLCRGESVWSLYGLPHEENHCFGEEEEASEIKHMAEKDALILFCFRVVSLGYIILN